jgi:hypothetical protein
MFLRGGGAVTLLLDDMLWCEWSSLWSVWGGFRRWGFPVRVIATPARSPPPPPPAHREIPPGASQVKSSQVPTLHKNI